MAEPLKRFFDRDRVERIADGLLAAWPAFPRDAFIADATRGLARLGLMDRAAHISAAMARHLPAAYPAALKVVLASMGPPLDAPDGNGMEPFHHLPHSLFIAAHGLGHVGLSLAAQRDLTKRGSCEFSIRPFIERHPAETLAALAEWTTDPDEHVRRLVSEGTRPRLPWGARLRAFQRDPAPVLALLERLRDDPSEYVRRSVANNLNDISKDHPDLAVATCRRWLHDASPQRRRLVHHALRSLVRDGHGEAIRLLGGGAGGRVEVVAALQPARVRIGEKVRIAVRLKNAGGTTATAVLALRIHFVKASGSTAPRTFRLPTVTLGPGGAAAVSKTVSLRQHTTRTHHPGRHRVEVVVNGDARPVGVFRLMAAPARTPTGKRAGNL